MKKYSSEPRYAASTSRSSAAASASACSTAPWRGEDAHDARGRLADDLAPGALGRVPDVGILGALRRQSLDDLQHEVMAVAEVDVEGRARQVRAPHHLVDGQVAERALAQQFLGGVDDLPFSNFGTPPSAAGPGVLRAPPSAHW